jgi:hypothetical protein
MRKKAAVPDQSAPAKTYAELQSYVGLLEKQNTVLKAAVREMHWMAVRYADGRETYAPSLLNEHIRACLEIGVELNAEGLESIFARDRADIPKKDPGPAPFVALSNKDLEEAKTVSFTETCPNCSQPHMVVYSKPDGQLQTVYCPSSDRTYMVGFRGKRIV